MAHRRSNDKLAQVMNKNRWASQAAQLAQKVEALLLAEGLDEGSDWKWRKGYSGRGMYDAVSPLAISVDRWSGPRSELGQKLQDLGLSVDNMGMGWIYYLHTTKGARLAGRSRLARILEEEGVIRQARQLGGRRLRRGDILVVTRAGKYPLYNAYPSGREVGLRKGDEVTVAAIGTGSGPDDIVGYSIRGDVVISPWDLDEKFALQESVEDYRTRKGLPPL